MEYRVKNAGDSLQRAYVKFQSDSILNHLRDLKQTLASLTASGARRPSLSINANFHSISPQNKSMIAGDVPDYFVGEGGDESLAGMFINAKVAEALRRQTIFSPFSYKVDVTRSEIALQYALGQLCLVPYDIWMHTSDLPRYFGKPADFADLFDFVRANASVFDSARTVSTIGIEVDPSKPEEKWFLPLVQALVEKNIPFSLLFPQKAPAGWHGRIHAGELTEETIKAAAVMEAEPSGVVALVRAGESAEGRFTAIHLVNRNFDEFSRLSVLQKFGLRLLQPGFWGAVRKVELLAPGAPPRTLTMQPFGRGWRIAVPELRDWTILRLS
jgi:hypothetical protein